MSRQDGFYASPDGRMVAVASTLGVLFSDDFGGTAIDSTRWQVFDAGYLPIAGGSATAIGAGAVVVSGSQIAITMPATSTAEYWLMSNAIFAGSEDVFLTLSRSASSVNNSCFVGLVEVDPSTGLPMLNANLANDFTNRGGFEFGKTAGASTYGVEAVADSSSAIASGTAGTSAATMATLQEFMAEIEAMDIIGSSQLIDTLASRIATPARVAAQCPNDGKAYRLLIRVKNTGATSCVWTIGRVLVKDGQEFRVEIASGRGDAIAQKALAANVIGTQDNTAAPSPFLVGGMMTSVVGGTSVGTSAFIGRLTLDLSRRLLVKPLGAPQSHVVSKATQTVATTDTQVLGAGGATIRIELQAITISNRDAVAHTIDIRDNTTTVWSAIVAAGVSFHMDFPGGLPAAAFNTPWQFQIRETATTAVEVSMSGYKTTA